MTAAASTSRPIGLAGHPRDQTIRAAAGVHSCKYRPAKLACAFFSSGGVRPARTLTLPASERDTVGAYSITEKACDGVSAQAKGGVHSKGGPCEFGSSHTRTFRNSLPLLKCDICVPASLIFALPQTQHGFGVVSYHDCDCALTRRMRLENRIKDLLHKQWLNQPYDPLEQPWILSAV